MARATPRCQGCLSTEIPCTARERSSRGWRRSSPEPVLFPSEEVREAERWGDEQLQDLGRRLPWGALHFRPELLAAIGGGEPLDGPGTDYAIRYIHSAWGYHRITAERLADDLAGLPEKLDHIQSLAKPV